MHEVYASQAVTTQPKITLVFAVGISQKRGKERRRQKRWLCEDDTEIRIMKFQVKEHQSHSVGQLLWLTSLLYKEHNFFFLDVNLVMRVLLVLELFYLLNLLCVHYLMVLQINS